MDSYNTIGYKNNLGYKTITTNKPKQEIGYNTYKDVIGYKQQVKFENCVLEKTDEELIYLPIGTGWAVLIKD